MAKNSNLHNAKTAKNDEFYTRYEDIAKELKNYKDFFKDKVVFCNCDDPLESNFTKYFILNFHHLGLKKLICTFYDVKGGSAFAFEYEGWDMDGNGVINERDIEAIRQSGACRTILVDDAGFDYENKEKCWEKGIYGSGDFRSKNVILYLKEADVVVTNPPFSLFREYVGQLMEYKKKFIIIGNMNAITYKEIFPLIKNNELWLGVSPRGIDFIMPNGKTSNVNAAWYTNVEHKKRNTPLDLYKRYTIEDYPKYDNYDAIEVSKTCDIPIDYEGVMGVPITFLDKYCPTQFEILDARTISLNDKQRNKSTYLIKDADGTINGKPTYARICIKKLA